MIKTYYIFFITILFSLPVVGLTQSDNFNVQFTVDEDRNQVIEKEVENNQNSTLVSRATNIVLFATTNTATINWQTPVSSRYILRWGKTSNYEAGLINGDVFNNKHDLVIKGLEPDTMYWYKLEAVSSRGQVTVIKEDTFITKSIFNPAVVTNVKNFTASVNETDVLLRWSQLAEVGIKYRVVRNHYFYPSSIDDGAVVYEGEANSYTDIGAMLEYGTQFYTIFTIHADGEISSGAIAKAVAVDISHSTSSGDKSDIDTAEIGDDKLLYPENVFIDQDDILDSLISSRLILKIGLPYQVSIPKEAVSKNLKSIIVSVFDTSNQKIISSYLLKLNQSGDTYAAVLPPMKNIGQTKLIIELYDYNQQTVRRIVTDLEFIDEDRPHQGIWGNLNRGADLWLLQRPVVVFWYLGPLLLLLFLWIRFRN